MSIDNLPILQTRRGRKIDDGNGASVDPTAAPEATSWRGRLLEPAEPADDFVPPWPPDVPAAGEERAQLTRESLVRQLHASATAAALDEARGADGLDVVWQMRDHLRAGQRLRRAKLKLRR